MKPSLPMIYICIVVCLVLTGLVILLWYPRQQYMHVGNTKISLEIANTPATIEQGLSGRDRIGADGMLFVLLHRETPTFWMKGMRFPLDFIWIDGNTIIDLIQDVPAPYVGTEDKDLKLYAPKAPVTHVLEVPAGFIQQHAVKIGDPVTLGVR